MVPSLGQAQPLAIGGWAGRWSHLRQACLASVTSPCLTGNVYEGRNCPSFGSGTPGWAYSQVERAGIGRAPPAHGGSACQHTLPAPGSHLLRVRACLAHRSGLCRGASARGGVSRPVAAVPPSLLLSAPPLVTQSPLSRSGERFLAPQVERGKERREESEWMTDEAMTSPHRLSSLSGPPSPRPRNPTAPQHGGAGGWACRGWPGEGERKRKTGDSRLARGPAARGVTSREPPLHHQTVPMRWSHFRLCSPSFRRTKQRFPPIGLNLHFLAASTRSRRGGNLSYDSSPTERGATPNHRPLVAVVGSALSEVLGPQERQDHERREREIRKEKRKRKTGDSRLARGPAARGVTSREPPLHHQTVPMRWSHFRLCSPSFRRTKQRFPPIGLNLHFLAASTRSRRGGNLSYDSSPTERGATP